MTRYKRLARCALFVSLLLVSCPWLSAQTRDIVVSIIRLIANPQKYDGEKVVVVGFLRLEFEGDMLYLHEEDYWRRIPENAVRLGILKKQRPEFEGKNMRYVIVVGTFKAAKPGTSNLNGSIVDITKIDIWDPAGMK